LRSPQILSTPIMPRSSLNLVRPSGFVKMSATWLSVLTNVTSILPSAAG
jgi:hypothetical protein